MKVRRIELKIKIKKEKISMFFEGIQIATKAPGHKAPQGNGKGPVSW